uniref:Limbic system-associated membrane protein-like n=1 Tax=Crassostrea virginica TaxID=6565 RepID=A0A8B8DRI9_CRAVI|nr:limbic system-associated membrane protein-like [Crassostrea virginica]
MWYKIDCNLEYFINPLCLHKGWNYQKFRTGTDGQLWLDTAPIRQRVRAGDTTVLGCTVENLGNSVVRWFGPGQSLLFSGVTAVSSDRRFSLARPYSSYWNLVIKHVKVGDQGIYRCQVQYPVTLTREITLEVQVAPQILPSSSSENQQVKEGSEVTIYCDATGFPSPKIMWHLIQDGKSKQLDTGEQLLLSNISREQTGVYRCTAINGVTPSASWDIKVEVEYAPTIIVKTPELSQERGKSAVLECTVVGFPRGQNYWRKDGNVLIRDWNYDPQDIQQNSTTTVMNLLIKQVEPPQGYGVYYCVAENQHGEVTGNVTLHEITTTTTTTTPSPTTVTTTTTTSTTTTTQSTTESTSTVSTLTPVRSSSAPSSLTSTQRPAATPSVSTRSPTTPVNPTTTSSYQPVVTSGPGYEINPGTQDNNAGVVSRPVKAIIVLVATTFFIL